MTSSQAGRELDALVAEKVMGYTWEDGALQHNDLPGGGRCHPQSTMNPPPAYSTDIAAAWEVVEKLNEDMAVEIMTGWAKIVLVRVKWWANAETIGHIEVESDTAPLTICLAALKAVGH